MFVVVCAIFYFAADAKTAQQISSSFDYLDELVRSNLEATSPGSASEAALEARSTEEDVVNGGPHDVEVARAGEEEEFPVTVPLAN